MELGFAFWLNEVLTTARVMTRLPVARTQLRRGADTTAHRMDAPRIVPFAAVVATIDALPLLIAKIRAQGFEFVRLDELIGVEPYLPADHDGDAVSSFLGDHPERH